MTLLCKLQVLVILLKVSEAKFLNRTQNINDSVPM